MYGSMFVSMLCRDKVVCNELRSDDESPSHGHPTEVMEELVKASAIAHGHLMALLEYDKWKASCGLLRSLGEALRSPEPAPMDEAGGSDDNDDDDNMGGPDETDSQKRRRYMNEEMCEVSGPDLWTDMH